MPKAAKKSSAKSNKKQSLTPLTVLQYFALGFLTIVAGGLITININTLLDKQKVLAASSQTSDTSDTTQLEDEKMFWEELVNKNPTYRDGFIELWDIEDKLGNKLKSQEYLNKAKKIDPNSTVIPLLESQHR